MTIAVNDKIPAVSLKVFGEQGPEDVTTDALFSGKKVVLFAVPGAFTPGCSRTHLPGFVALASEIKAKGVDSIICMSVNDAFVMDEWGKAHNADELTMLADGNAEFAKALGLELDASGHGMGIRSKRFALIANDGVVEHLNVDVKGIDVSSAENTLSLL